MARIRMAIVVCMASAATGCSSIGSDDADPGFGAASVQGLQWELVSMGGKPVRVSFSCSVARGR